MPIAVITGGSRGIGAETAKLMARQGYDVCLTYHNDRDAAESVAEVVSAQGQRALITRCDVAVESEVVQLFERCDQELGRPTVLVNNAGILQTQAKVRDLTHPRIMRILEVNVAGAMLCCREAIRRMARSSGGEGGAIVNVSSAAARSGSPNEYVDYAASKGALDSMTIGLSKELAPEGIRVNAVRPAFTYTDIHASGGEAGRVDRVAPGLPMRRGGTPLEVAQAICWLASDLSSYVTGTFIEMSGGV